MSGRRFMVIHPNEYEMFYCSISTLFLGRKTDYDDSSSWERIEARNISRGGHSNRLNAQLFTPSRHKFTTGLRDVPRVCIRDWTTSTMRRQKNGQSRSSHTTVEDLALDHQMSSTDPLPIAKRWAYHRSISGHPRTRLGIEWSTCNYIQSSLSAVFVSFLNQRRGTSDLLIATETHLTYYRVRVLCACQDCHVAVAYGQ